MNELANILQKNHVLLNFTSDCSIAKNYMKTNISAVTKNVRKLLRKLKESDIAERHFSVDANDCIKFSMKLSKPTGLLYSAENLTTKSSWLELPYMCLEISPITSKEQVISQPETSPHKNTIHNIINKLEQIETAIDEIKLVSQNNLAQDLVDIISSPVKSAALKFPNSVTPKNMAVKKLKPQPTTPVAYLHNFDKVIDAVAKNYDKCDNTSQLADEPSLPKKRKGEVSMQNFEDFKAALELSQSTKKVHKHKKRHLKEETEISQVADKEKPKSKKSTKKADFFSNSNDI